MERNRPVLSILGLTGLRVGLGAIMAAHGWQKVVNLDATITSFGEMGIPWPDLLVWPAIASELGGGILLVLGFITPLAALLILATMLTAIFVVHIGNGLFAANGGYELPLVIALVATYFLLRGAGPVSIDAAIGSLARRRRVRETPQREREASGLAGAPAR